MELTLIQMEEKYRSLAEELMAEWTAAGETIIPYAIRKTDYRDFSAWLDSLEVHEPCPEGLVPDSTYFCLDTRRNKLVGAVNIRHRLNEGLLLNGGHIGDGVRPSERGKGIGTRMVGLALEKCRALGLDRVLMVCDKDNVASARTILHNGGVLENEVLVDGVTEQRYWIEL